MFASFYNLHQLLLLYVSSSLVPDAFLDGFLPLIVCLVILYTATVVLVNVKIWSNSTLVHTPLVVEIFSCSPTYQLIINRLFLNNSLILGSRCWWFGSLASRTALYLVHIVLELSSHYVIIVFFEEFSDEFLVGVKIRLGNLVLHRELCLPARG